MIFEIPRKRPNEPWASAIGATYRLIYLILEVATHKVWKNHIVSFLTRKQIVRLNS